MRIFSCTNGGQERKFHGGMQQISLNMARELGSTYNTRDRYIGLSLYTHTAIYIEHLRKFSVFQYYLCPY